MNNEYRIILQILNAFLNNKKMTVSKHCDWKKVNKLLEINSITGIAGYVFSELTEGDIPKPVLEKLLNDYLNTISISTIRDEAMKDLIDQMNQQEIDHLLFKGLIVKDLYTVPELRTFGDVDFAIRKSDRGKSNGMMLRLGYQVHDDWEPVYSYHRDLENYEIHTQIMDSDINGRMSIQEFFSNFWKHAVQKDKCTYVLDEEYHLIYLMAHIAKHIYSSGAGIRMYLDIAFYLLKYRDTINWSHFQKEVHQLNLERFVKTVFVAVETWFDVKSPIPTENLDTEFLNSFLAFTMNGGVFGFEDKSFGEVDLRKNAKGGKINRMSTFFHRAFPSASTLEVRYSYLQGKHWLLPAAWIHRVLKKKHSTTEYVRETKDIFFADEAELKQTQRLYNKIGL